MANNSLVPSSVAPIKTNTQVRSSSSRTLALLCFSATVFGPQSLFLLALTLSGLSALSLPVYDVPSLVGPFHQTLVFRPQPVPKSSLPAEAAIPAVLSPPIALASVGRGNRGTMLRDLLALLAFLERAPGPARPTAALPKIAPMEPIRTPFPRAQRRPLEPGSPPQRSAATQPGQTPNSVGPITPEKIRAAFL
jgi:hypothetical protein